MSSVTATEKDTLQTALDRATPGQTDDALQRVKLGTILTPLKRTFTGLTSLAAQDLTAIDATGETTGVANPNRLAALVISNVRVTAGAAAAGARFIGDTGATPSTTVATLSDDGKILTFEAAVTAFVVTYVPRASADMASDFALSS